MKREVKIGIFTIAIICCSWAGIRFLSGIDIFGRNVNYYACYDQIGGINSASPILVQGVKVGKVTDIILDPASSDKVTLKLSIKRRYVIPSDSKVRIYSPGLMSSMAIGLTLGSSTEQLYGGDTITSTVEQSLIDSTSDIMMGVVDQITTIAEQLTEALGSINTILGNSGSDIEATLANLSVISEEISSFVTTRSSSLHSAVDDLSSFSQSLNRNTEGIERIICNLDSLSTELAQEDLGGSISQTLAQLNTTLDSVNSTDGSAGKLINDEQLYDNLAALSGSLNELILDMQSNPKRYVHFSLFGSKEKSL